MLCIMSTCDLPPHLLSSVVVSGGEFGWRKDDFLPVLPNPTRAMTFCTKYAAGA